MVSRTQAAITHTGRQTTPSTSICKDTHIRLFVRLSVWLSGLVWSGLSAGCVADMFAPGAAQFCGPDCDMVFQARA